jgi:hypothetical protein
MSWADIVKGKKKSKKYCGNRDCGLFGTIKEIPVNQCVYKCEECESHLASYSSKYETYTNMTKCARRKGLECENDTNHCYVECEYGPSSPKKFSCDACLRQIFSYHVYDFDEEDEFEIACAIEQHRSSVECEAQIR